MTTRRASILDDLVDTIGEITGLTGGASLQVHTGARLLYPHALIGWSSDTVLTEQSGRLLNRSLRVTIAIFFQVDGTQDTVSAEQAEEWIAAIEAAALADRGRGGYAVDTRLVESTLFPVLEGAPEAGGSVALDIVYQERI